MGKDKKPKLSKKELRKLEEKAARKAEKKAAAKAAEKRDKMKKASKKAKVKGSADPTESAASATGAVDTSEQHPHLQHLDRVGTLNLVANDKSEQKTVRQAAKAELAKLRAAGEEINAKKAEPEKTLEQQDAEMKARIAAKRAAEGTDKKASLRKLQQYVADANAWKGPDDVAADRAADGPVDFSKLTLADVTPEAEPVAASYADAEAAHDADETAEREAESTPVETVVENFAMPSEAPKVDFEENGNRQYLVKRPSDGKMVGYTRTTTYIKVLEDTTMLTKWKMRILLEGVAAVETPDADGKMDEPVTARVRDLLHNRDVAIAKARKADRKGKLHPGQLAVLVDGAWGDFKKAVDKLAEEVFEIGGGHEAATKGTDIHALCDIADTEGIDAVGEKLQAGEITPADLADVEAYVAATKRLGLKVMAQEQVIVNDELKVAGRLDRVFLAKLPAIIDPKTGEEVRPADTRAKRYIGDLKTGRIDYGAGKIAQQLRMYAASKAYDLNTHERSSHGANPTTGIVIHLPAGSATVSIQLVDLGIGQRGNKLAGEVRAFRNEGRKAISPVNLLDMLEQPEAEEA